MTLAALWGWSCVDIHQIAHATPQHAIGVVCWNGDLYFYAAERYDGTFARHGALLTGPIDVALDPDSHWGYGFALGYNLDGVRFWAPLHGAVWTGLELPLGTVTLIFALYPVSHPIDGALKRARILRRARRWARLRRCATCGYDLTGNISGICPECGSPTRAMEPS